MAKEKRSLEDVLLSINELVELQQKALEIADNLLRLKDEQVAIADRLNNIYKKENKALIILSVGVVVLNILSLLIRFL